LFVFSSNNLIFMALNSKKVPFGKMGNSVSFPIIIYMGKFIKFSQQKNLIFHDR